MLYMNDFTQERLLVTFSFAMQDPQRFTSFIQKLAYVENWGRKEGYPDPSVQVYCDHEPHSFLFHIKCARNWNAERRVIEYDENPFVLCLYYRAESDRWETHS